MRKIVFGLVTLPKLFSDVSAHLYLLFFFMLFFFWRTIQLLYINFFVDVVGITLGVYHERVLFTASPHLLKAILRYFEAYWAMFLYFSRAVSSYLIKFCTVDVCITLTVNGLRKNLQHLFLCWGIF